MEEIFNKTKPDKHVFKYSDYLVFPHFPSLQVPLKFCHTGSTAVLFQLHVGHSNLSSATKLAFKQ